MAYEKTGTELEAKGADEFLSLMRRAQEAMNAFGGSTSDAANKMQAFGAASKQAQKVDSLTNTLSEQRKELSILEQELQKTIAKYGEGSIQAQKKQLAIDKLSNSIRENEARLEQEQRALGKHAQALEDAAKEADQAAQATEEAGDAIKGTGDDAREARPSIAKLGNTAAETGEQFDEAARGISIFGEMAIGALRRAGEFAVEMFAEMGRAAVDFIGDSIGVAGDFEAGMNRFGVAAGDALEEAEIPLEDFRDLFLDIGKELPVSTQEVQEAAIELVKGGLDPMILKLGGLEDAINFAAAAELGLEEAATLSIKQLGVWTSATATAEEQTAFLAMSQDLLVKAAGASTVNVDKLAAAMNNAGGQAKALDLNYKDFVTGITLVSPAFSSAEQAGTSFNVFLKQLQPSTDPATAAMQELGLWTAETGSAFFDANGEYVGNREAAELLKVATENLTDAKKAELMETIFGIEGMVTANTLAEQGAEGYDILTGKIEAASSVQEAAAAKQQGFNTAMDNFKGSVEALQITIGSALLPVLTDLFNNYLAPGINAISDFADRIFAASDPIAALVAEIDRLIPGFSGIITTVQNVVSWFATAGTQTSALATQAGSLASGALQFLTHAWNDDVLPAVQTVSGFFVSDIMPILDNVAQTVLPILNSALQVAAGFWDNVLVPALKLAWNLISTVVVPILSELTTWLKENLPPAVQMVADFLTGTLFPALNTVYTFINDNVVPIIKALADVYFAAVSKAVEALAGLWKSTLEPALDDLWSLLDQHVGPILEDFSEWLEDVTGGVEGVAGAIKTAVDWLSDLADSIANLDLPDWLTPGSPTPLEIALYGIADALRDVVRGGNLFGAELNDINSALETTSGLIADVFGSQADMFRGRASNMDRLEQLREDLDPTNFAVLETSLRGALEASQQFTDPEQAAQYYDLLSRHAFELADIRAQIAEEEDHATRERMYDQMRLIQQAQEAEIAAFQERARYADNPYQELFDQLEAIEMEIQGNMPPELMALYAAIAQLGAFGGTRASGGPVEAGRGYIVGEEGPEYFVPRQDGMILNNAMSEAWQRAISPVAGAQQMMGNTNNYYYGQVGSNYPMSVHTNNSPAAVFQSYQTVRAAVGWGA